MKIEVRNLEEKRSKMYPKQQCYGYGEKKELFKRAIECYKGMYKCARECSADRFFLINDILIPGHNCAMTAHKFATSSDDKILAELFKEDVKCFATAGRKLSKIIYGENSTLEEGFKLVE